MKTMCAVLSYFFVEGAGCDQHHCHAGRNAEPALPAHHAREKLIPHNCGMPLKDGQFCFPSR
jgi:hypothetical protein